MQNWIVPHGQTQNIAILLWPRFSNHCLANAVEPLRAANDVLMQPAYDWRFVTLDGAPVRSSSGLPVQPDGPLRDHPGGDMLWVIAGYDVRDFTTPANRRALRAAAARFHSVAGLDMGAWLMADAGLLERRRATLHWDELTAFAEGFPMVKVTPDRFVQDRNTLTCGGAMTAFDLVLDLIRARHGAAIALEVSAFFLHHSLTPPGNRAYRHAGSGPVQSALRLMSHNLETPLTIQALAARIGVTQRTLTRSFQAELGVPPKTVYKRLRLAAARRYAQHSRYSMIEIALRCGYTNAAAMTRAFVEEFGHPPSALRGRPHVPDAPPPQ